MVVVVTGIDNWRWVNWGPGFKKLVPILTTEVVAGIGFKSHSSLHCSHLPWIEVLEGGIESSSLHLVKNQSGYCSTYEDFIAQGLEQLTEGSAMSKGKAVCWCSKNKGIDWSWVGAYLHLELLYNFGSVISLSGLTLPFSIEDIDLTNSQISARWKWIKKRV